MATENTYDFSINMVHIRSVPSTLDDNTLAKLNHGYNFETNLA